MSVEVLLLFATATAAFAVMPDRAMPYTVGRTLSDGWSAGLKATAGVHLGRYVHVFAAVAGLAILLEAVPVLYAMLKLVSVAYLLWIGFGALRSSSQQAAAKLPRTRPSTFSQSALVEALNPKAAPFYLAFLPQFTIADATMSVPLQLLVLGLIVNACFSMADVVYVLAHGLHRRLARTGAALWLRRTGSAILVELGLNLTFSRT